MAQKDAQAFMDHLDRDPELQKKVRELQSSVAELAKQHGYQFSLKEFHQHLRDRWETSPPDGGDDPDTCCICVPFFCA